MKSLYWKITLPTIALTVMCLAALGLQTVGAARNAQLNQLQTHLINEARLSADDSSSLFAVGDTQALNQLAKTIGQQIEARITFIAKDGTVFGDSWEDPASMENHATRPEVIQALATGVGVSTRFSATVGQQMMYAAVPVMSASQPVGIARVALPLTAVQQVTNQATRTIILALAAATLLIILFTALVVRRIISPLRQITRATEAMTAGDLDQTVAINTGDELGRLGHAFNRMASELSRSTATALAEKNRLSSVLANLADGVIMTGGDGNVVLANPAAGRLFGFDPAQTSGRSLIATTHDHEIEALYRKCLTTRREAAAQIEVRNRFLRVIAAPLPSDQPGGGLILCQDLTELRGLQTMRQEFVANISHELRTPLAGIKAIVETLQSGALEDKNIAAEFLEKMDSEVDRLSQLVSELMELSRIESGNIKLALKPTSLNQLAEEAIARLAPQAQRRQLALAAQLDPDLLPVPADGERLLHVFTNILHNAIKFTPPGGRITVTSRQTDNDAVISIADTGTGIIPEDLPHIFERFYKADKSRASQGTGLGLAIARHIIQAHGGKIWAESRPGKGSIFSFSLPLNSLV